MSECPREFVDGNGRWKVVRCGKWSCPKCQREMTAELVGKSTTPVKRMRSPLFMISFY